MQDAAAIVQIGDIGVLLAPSGADDVIGLNDVAPRHEWCTMTTFSFPKRCCATVIERSAADRVRAA
jgi:hypothetical protein